MNSTNPINVTLPKVAKKSKAAVAVAVSFTKNLGKIGQHW